MHHRLNYGLKSATTAKTRQNWVSKGSLLYLITKKVLIFSGKKWKQFWQNLIQKEIGFFLSKGLFAAAFAQVQI